jgi:hypothetical protein
VSKHECAANCIYKQLTGATGFVGYKVLVHLVKAGYNVRAAVRNLAGFEKIKALKSTSPYQSELEHIIVPDITAPGAYDEAVKGVKFILHVASPFASPDLFTGDYETSYIQPAVRGTVGMLDSAGKAEGIERVVITASILSIASFAVAGTSAVVNGRYILTIYSSSSLVLMTLIQRNIGAQRPKDRIRTG